MGINTCCNNSDVGKKELTVFPRDNQSAACKQTLEKYFPGARTGADCDNLVGGCLQERGFTDENTLYTDSSCPDEINHDSPGEDITSIFQARWGEIFPLGGLAGLPFTGKTGWHAFSSHCPEDGNIVVLCAPHVGIDKDGIVGKIHRAGQRESTGACGAAQGALKALKTAQFTGLNSENYLDYQINIIMPQK